MAAAGGEERAVGVLLQEVANRADANFRIRQIVQAKFEEALATRDLRTSVRQKRLHIGESEGDAGLRERLAKRHWGLISIAFQGKTAEERIVFSLVWLC